MAPLSCTLFTQDLTALSDFMRNIKKNKKIKDFIKENYFALKYKNTANYKSVPVFLQKMTCFIYLTLNSILWL